MKNTICHVEIPFVWKSIFIGFCCHQINGFTGAMSLRIIHLRYSLLLMFAYDFESQKIVSLIRAGPESLSQLKHRFIPCAHLHADWAFF